MRQYQTYIQRILVTGSAGFIGSAVARYLIAKTDALVINLDKLTYAGNLDNLLPVHHHPRYRFERLDICEATGLEEAFWKYRPDGVMHLAAESHVDRSIDGPAAFIETNVVGTYTLLEVARHYWETLPEPARSRFRFLHVSTDEVYGSLGEGGAVLRDLAPSAEFTICGEQGCLRSPGPRLASHLRAARAHHQLLQ